LKIRIAFEGVKHAGWCGAPRPAPRTINAVSRVHCWKKTRRMASAF